MKIIRTACAIIAVMGIALAAYTQIMLRTGSGTPPEMARSDQQADAVLVDKSDRKLVLLRDGKPIREYRISLGANPEGHKTQEGDERTPEGDYVIDWRNADSIAHLSLHISYPNRNDHEQAKARGVDPGGNIMIHGLLNGWGWLGRVHRRWDWTNGCIAVTDAEVREIWSLVPDGTPIEIRE